MGEVRGMGKRIGRDQAGISSSYSNSALTGGMLTLQSFAEIEHKK
jgi:hypothetical protein